MAQTLLRETLLGETQLGEPQLRETATQARQALARSRIFDLRNLQVHDDDECVVLRGNVGSYYHKQLAQELVRAAVDGAEVINEITVDYRQRHDGQFAW
jgi:osmotically-inducible protein OsmY